MSVIITAKIWVLRGIPATTKLIILKLADNADDQGKCWPSVPHIASECEVSPRTVQAAITWAEKFGLIKREMRPGKSTVYQIVPSRFKAPPQILHPRNPQHAPPQITAPTPADYSTTHIEPSKDKPSIEEPSGELPTATPESGLFGDMDKKPKIKKFNPLAVMLPEWLPALIWADWCDHRIAVKKPLSQKSADLSLRELEKLRAQKHDPIKVIEQSIMRGWAGLFGIKPEFSSNNGTHAPKKTYSETIQTAMDKARENLSRSEIYENI